MILSKASQYALRALIFVTVHTERDEYFSIRQIAEKLEIPFHFLTKIFQKLNTAGIVDSSRGATGGIRLSKSAEEVFLREIFFAVDGASFLKSCVIGFPHCDDAHPCALHHLWKEPQSSIRSMVEETSLRDLAVNEAMAKI